MDQRIPEPRSELQIPERESKARVLAVSVIVVFAIAAIAVFAMATRSPSESSSATVPTAISLSRAPRQSTPLSGRDVAQGASPPGISQFLNSFGPDNVKPVDAQDHILESINAPVKIVEFSDFECPFCKRFHSTMHQLIDEYGASGQVAWIYRHLINDETHPKARIEAEAAECAGELGGNEKFWAYADRIFEITPSNNNLDLALLPQIADEVGLPRLAFERCLASRKYAPHVQADIDDALRSGADGTPYSILIAKNGEKFPISGAPSYSALQQLVDTALRFLRVQ